MAAAREANEHDGLLPCVIGWTMSVNEKLRRKIVEVAVTAKELGKDDPRRITHSLKVGLAIMLVSLLYYFDPPFRNYGDSAMWAVITVVVVFEFYVGATLKKGLNRALATAVAGALGFGAHHLAGLSGKTAEPIMLGLLVFTLAAVVTFLRFFPKLKARCDYGLMIFILTFSLVSVSGYRDAEVLEIAHERLLTIIIGSFTSVAVSVLIWPAWAGDDLHNLTVTNMDKLGDFLEGFGREYFNNESVNGESKEKMLGYKSVLNSKQSEELLVNLAKWEPAHDRFRFRHPWDQYHKIGTQIRQCACQVEALNNYLSCKNQTSPHNRSKIQEEGAKLSSESGKALKELASTIKKMKKSPSAGPHILNSKNAAKKLKSLLKESLRQDVDFVELVPVATVVSLLIDISVSTEKVADSVYGLWSLAKFQNATAEIPQMNQTWIHPVHPSAHARQSHVITMPE